MLANILLDTIIADRSRGGVKVYNGQLLSPLVFDAHKHIRELESLEMINVPIIEDTDLDEEMLDLLLVELLRGSKRCAEFDVLNTEHKNIRGFIKRAIRNFREHVGIRSRKIAVISKNLSEIREPFQQLLRAFEYVEFLEHPLMSEEIFIVPLDVKCGAIVTQGKGKQKYGMVLYEECVKKLLFYTDDDLRGVMSQLMEDLESGEI